MRRPNGFGLLAALWLLVAISGALLQLSLWARHRRLAAANALESIEARAASQAGLEHARAALSRAAASTGGGLGGPDPWIRADTLFGNPLSLGRAQVGVEVRDVASRLNLNSAEVEELSRFFTALGLAGQDAGAMAAAVADWRDPDDDSRAGGTETAEYLGSRRPRLPANAPFQTLEELQYVRGMTEPLYSMAMPHLTLAGTGQINLNTAGRPVLLALEGMPETAAEVLALRRALGRPVASLLELVYELPPDDRQQLEARLPWLTARTAVEVQTVRVQAVGEVVGSPVHVYAETYFTRVGQAVLESGRTVGP